MTPEEIMQAYDVLVQEGNQYAAQEAAKVGNSQRSIGGLAEVVANPSGQTSGLANYTYNRLLRPTVDTLAASLTTTGKSQALDRYLKDELMKAKNAYEDAKNNYTVAATSPKTNPNNPETPYSEQTDPEYTGEQVPYTAKGTIIGVGSSGNGAYDIIVADGNGGTEIHQYIAKSAEEARQAYLRDYRADGTKISGSEKYLKSMENGVMPINQMVKRLNEQRGGVDG